MIKVPDFKDVCELNKLRRVANEARILVNKIRDSSLIDDVTREDASYISFLLEGMSKRFEEEEKENIVEVQK